MDASEFWLGGLPQWISVALAVPGAGAVLAVSRPKWKRWRTARARRPVAEIPCCWHWAGDERIRCCQCELEAHYDSSGTPAPCEYPPDKVSAIRHERLDRQAGVRAAAIESEPPFPDFPVRVVDEGGDLVIPEFRVPYTGAWARRAATRGRRPQ